MRWRSAKTRCAANDKSFKLRLRSISKSVLPFVPCLPPYSIGRPYRRCYTPATHRRPLPSYLPSRTYAIYHECYTLVISTFLLGLYLGSESRSANRLPDFSATSCTEPLLVLSTGHIIRRQYPHECFTLVIPFCSLGLYLGSESRSANRLPDFSAASCTEPLLVLSTWPHHTQAIPVACYPPPTPTILGFGIAQC